MNKQELIQQVAEDTELTQKQAEAALNSILNAIVSTVSSGESVRLVGFGTFAAKERSARTGRNPKTLEEIRISASVAPVFKAGRAFKDAVKG